MRYLIILIALLSVSCGTALPTVKPYKLDVQQGNVVSSKMLLQLRPSMTKSQVRFIMGTPLIQDSFHGNRWDYVYQMRESGKITEQRRVILDFENELLKAVRGDVIPAGSDQSKLKESEANTGTRVVTPSKKPEEKSLLNKLKFWEKDEAAPALVAAEKAAVAKAEMEAVKVKAEAEESAKKAAMTGQEKVIPAAEESKSLLAVPLEVPVAPVPPIEPSPTKPLVVAPAVARPAEVVVEKPAEAATSSPQEPTVKTPSYESPSGMVFDEKLRLAPEEVKPVARPAVTEARAGNKVPPKPKDLPEEGSPSFFDRMLEKIGF